MCIRDRLSVGQIVEALGMLLGWEAPAGQRSQEALDLLAQTRSLLVDGFLEPAAEDAAAEDRAGAVRA